MAGGWRGLVVVWAIGLGMGSSCRGQGSLPTNGVAARKVATVSLKPYGWMSQRELSAQHTVTEGKYKGWLQSGPPGGVAWSGVGTVVVNGQGSVFVGLPIWASGSAPRSAVRGDGDKLRVVEVRVDGKVGRTMDFPTASLGRIDLRLAGDGALMVMAVDELMRVGTDGRATARLAIPNEEKEYEPWSVESSVSGKTVRLRLNSKSRLLVDAETLTVLKRCQEADDSNDEGSYTEDLELMSEVEGKFPDFKYGLEKEAFCGRRERLMAFGDIEFVPQLVDEGRFLAIRKGAIALRSLSGETVWTTKAPAGRMFEGSENEARLSRDGRRVALRVLRPYVYREPMDFEGRPAGPVLKRVQHPWENRPRTKTLELEEKIEVLDVASGKVVAAAPIQEIDGDLNFKPMAAYDLGPDGRELAILQDGELVIWRVD